MVEHNDAIDKITDGNCFDNVFLVDDRGRRIEFEQVAYIPIGDVEYVILKPMDDVEGVAENEAIAFYIDKRSEEEDILTVVDDDEVIDMVFEEYYRMVDESEKE
ncbi:MAG: DUF1292 domain-containing protein [Candidatus Methanomethylophilaceae archaeon]